MKVKNGLKCLSTLFVIFTTLFLIAAPNASALTKNIKVADVIVKEKSGTISVVDPVLSDNEITSNITFNKKDDFATFEFSLENNESEKYKIESISDNNTNENIEIDYSFSENYIDAGGSDTVAIKLTYKNALINVDKISIDDLTIKIYLVNEDGESGEIIINPITSDKLPLNLAILVVALVGLALLFKNKKNKVIKIGGVFVALLILSIPLTALAKEKYEVQIRFTDIDIIGEFETYNITINPGNGDEILVVPVQYGNKLESLPANPSKDGYDFDKWVDSNGNTVTSDTVITGPITVEAQYTIKHYAINYDLDGGSLPDGKTNPSDYTIEDEITVNNPEKLGYTFTGWSGTGIDGQTTNLAIPAGSKDERSYVANYSANENTPYTVTHRYQNLDDLTTYTESTVTEYGETDKTIPAPRQERTGFVTPAVQNVTVNADGSASVTYTYDRETYLYGVTDRTYITDDSTANGSYPYETSITVKAQERAGYTFAWNDGDTSYERTFELTDAVSLTPVYTAKTNTKYVVKHYKQKLTLDGYEIADTQNLAGTTDEPISPAVNSYIGFKSPAVQSTTIAGDESTKVDYYYDRETYAFSFNNNENVTSTKPADSYPYETVITLTANEVAGKTFGKWSNDETDNPLTITLTGDLTIEPIYTNNTVTVTFDTNDGTAIAEQIIESGTKVATPADPTKENYIFDGWFTDKTYSTTFDFNQNITQDTTIYAKFMLDPFPTVFKQEGACIFNGADGVITGDDCDYANGINKYIDTGISLYNSENHDKDYEIGFTIVSYNSDENVKQATFMNTKLEGNNYPGVVFRKYDNRNDLDLSSRKTTSANERRAINYADEMTVKIYRITDKTTNVQEIFYSINGGAKVKINDLSQFNPEFNISVWFGAAPVNTSANTAQRILVGTLSNMYIKLGEYGSVNYTVTHQKQKINSDEYEIDETEFLAAKPGTSVTPETKNYTGFEAPGKQTVNISGDGDTKIIYSYTRNKYNLTVEGEEFIEEGDISGEYYYGDTITLTAKEREGYTFDKWNNGVRDSRLILTKDAKDETIYAKYIPTIESDKLYDVIKNQVIDLGGYEIDFTKAATEKYDIAESNGNGVNKYTEKDQDIYYYRGEVDNNNVIWADTCWKIIRTTYTSGVKMIYNGLPSEMDGVQQCNNRGVNITYEGKTDFPFNINDNSPADVGYMYGVRLTQKTISADSTIFIFANDVSYDPETKNYNLITGDDKSITGTWSSKHKEAAKKYHYFCTDGEESCDGTKIGYIHDYGYNSNSISYLEISPYANIEEAKAAMFANENDSNAKRVVEGWFEQANLDGHEAGSYNYENDLEDAIFCNDRTLSSGPLASKDGEAYMIGLDSYAYNFSYFGAERIKSPSLDCPRQDDAFTKTDKVNGNGMLKHKVGLITADELNLVGYSDDNLYSEWINWALTPGAFGDHGRAYLTRWISGTPYYYAEISWSERIRPVISLKAGATFKKGGNGTKTNPYVIERFEN